MAVLQLTGLMKTGQYVSSDMFGANAVFELTENGVPSAAYRAAADALGVQNIRFGGGQADLDPTRMNAAGARPVDGVNAIDITQMPGGALRPELVNFLDWCEASTAAGRPVTTTLIIPTKNLDVRGFAANWAELEDFVQTVTARYGDVISAFQIGNEYWEMGETAYGQKADMAAQALERGMLAAGLTPDRQPDILIQMGTAGNAGSEYPATPGVQDFLARNEAANLQIIDQLSAGARAAIDGVTEHYYYNRSGFEFRDTQADVQNINRDHAVWEESFGRALDLHITEWNVKTTTPDQHGIVSASTLINQFANMVEIGADAASVWAIDYHSRTALTLDTDEGPRLDAQGRLVNSPNGAAFDLMSETLVGKQLVDLSFAQEVPGIEVRAFTSSQEMVVYISSRSTERSVLSLDLSSVLPAGRAEGVKVSMDPGTSNGKQWVAGEDANSIEVDGGRYFYNEHDVDVILTDLVFEDLSEIEFMLNPFEVLQLNVDVDPSAMANVPTISKKETPETGPDPEPEPAPTGILSSDKHYILGTDVDDLILWTDNVVYIDGDEGIDTVIVDGNGVDARFKIDGLGKAMMSLDDFQTVVHLNNVERIAFNDGVLGADVEGNAGQAFRLYQASFNRTPDEAGLEFWVDVLDSGELTLVEVARQFLDSEEFGKTYGDKDTLTDEAYLDLLYENVLDRRPDAPGYAFWSEQQDNGLGMDEMLVYFSESAENKAQVAPLIDDGIWFS